MGMALAHLVIKLFYERKNPVNATGSISEYTSFLSLITKKGVFKTSELGEVQESKLKGMLRAAEDSGLLTSYGTFSKLYVVNYPALWGSLGGLLKHLMEVTKLVHEARDKLVVLNDQDYDKLADMGVKSLGIICQEDTVPNVKCFTAVTELVIRMIRDPDFLAQVYERGRESTMIRVAEGVILLRSLPSSSVEGNNEALVFAEVSAPVKERDVHMFLNALAERIERSGLTNAGNLINYVSEILH